MGNAHFFVGGRGIQKTEDNKTRISTMYCFLNAYTLLKVETKSGGEESVIASGWVLRTAKYDGWLCQFYSVWVTVFWIQPPNELKHTPVVRMYVKVLSN